MSGVAEGETFDMMIMWDMHNRTTKEQAEKNES
jgi:hypothetical protein